MMPAQLMSCAVPMFTDAPPQPFDFIHQLLTRHPFEILVHESLTLP